VTINQRNKFFCAVGWDKRIRLYPDLQGGDIQDEYKQYQHPMPFWKSDLDHGHRDDIVAVTYCPPHLLATCDYSGNIFFWNHVSGHIFKKFLYKSVKPIKDSSIQVNHCIAGFPKRHEENENLITEQFSRPSTRNLQADMKKQQSAVIAVGTVDGNVSFYSTSAVNNHGSFCVTSRDNNKTAPSVTKIKISLDETRMIVGDADGYVTILDVTNYALVEESKPPRVLYRWRAHTSAINDIEIVVRPDTTAQVLDPESSDFIDRYQIATVSNDKRCRFWTLTGEWIGTFGQQKPWEIDFSETWQSPQSPEDVLFKPDSLPKNENDSDGDYEEIANLLYETDIAKINPGGDIKKPNRQTVVENPVIRPKKVATIQEVEQYVKDMQPKLKEMMPTKPSGDADFKNWTAGKQLRAVKIIKERERILNDPKPGETAFVNKYTGSKFREIPIFDLESVPSGIKTKEVTDISTKLVDDDSFEKVVEKKGKHVKFRNES